MQKKIALPSVLMIALITLSLQFPVAAYVKKECILHPIISGSSVDNRAFYAFGHIVADGFAVNASMDLPVAVKTPTQTRFSFAVGLGDKWTEYETYGGISYWYQYTPYVNHMWLKIQGDADYSVTSLGSIADNTGTGDSSSLFVTVLEALGLLFTLYDITNFVPIAYEEPPSEEWQRDEHWAEAIVRQSGDPRAYPRLQTACASLMSYFHSHKWNILNITAEAKVMLQRHCISNPPLSGNFYIGTYRSSFEVKVVANEPPKTPSKPSGSASVYMGVTYDYSSSTTDPEDDNVRYEFDWGDGSPNTLTDSCASGATATASHSWSSIGTYNVVVRAQDSTGAWSDPSPYLAVVTVENLAVEDFTTYTETDPNNDLSQTAARASWTTMDRNYNSWLTKDYGAGHFGDFDILFDFKISALEAGDTSWRAIVTPITLSQQVVSGNGAADDSIQVLLGQNAAIDTNYWIALQHYDGGVLQFNIHTASGPYCAVGTIYYGQMERSTTFRLRIYTDAARTNLFWDSGNQIGAADTYRYLTVTRGYDFANDPNDWSTGFIENLDLQEP